MSKEQKNTEGQEDSKVCGIVRPIAGTSEIYTALHWENVDEIISEAATKAGFKPNLVSDTNEVSVIHKTIINNLYNNDIVVVDVSSKNPNVMFELGIRLTFDKPTVIIKDELTNYSFDTAVIEHLQYPADLHYQSIVKFKDKLTNKILATADKHNSFLKNFGQFAVSKLETTILPESEYIIRALESLKKDISTIKSNIDNSASKDLSNSDHARHLLQKYWRLYKVDKALPVDLLLDNVNSDDFVDYLSDNLTARDKERISSLSHATIKDALSTFTKA